MKTVKELVYGMLTEGTGTHMCDSGGSDGRGWQRNQKRTIEDFDNEDEEVYSFDERDGEIMRTVSVFHYLTNNLECDDICDEFNQIQEDSDDWDAVCSAYGVSEKAWEYLKNIHDDDDGWEVLSLKRTWNTYNGDSDLSQVLQGADLEINEEQYVLIQIHNGADVRGGYTDAKLFKRGDHCDYMIHEYLSEYMDSYDIDEALREGYIETFIDYMEGDSKTYTLEQVRNRILEILI
jgi:hypothetical protein